MPLKFTLPLKIVSPNVSEHWTAKYKRSKAQQNALALVLKLSLATVSLPCTVTLIRLGTRPLDFDNLVFSLKAVRDFISSLLVPGLAPGQADSDKRITWVYQQGKGSKQMKYGLVIEIDDQLPF